MQLFLSAVDHEHMKTMFVGALNPNVMDYDDVVDMTGVQSFREKIMTEEPLKNVTLVRLFIAAAMIRLIWQSSLCHYSTFLQHSVFIR